MHLDAPGPLPSVHVLLAAWQSASQFKLASHCLSPSHSFSFLLACSCHNPLRWRRRRRRRRLRARLPFFSLCRSSHLGFRVSVVGSCTQGWQLNGGRFSVRAAASAGKKNVAGRVLEHYWDSCFGGLVVIGQLGMSGWMDGLMDGGVGWVVLRRLMWGWFWKDDDGGDGGKESRF